jgi:hypothetical protein
MCRNLTDQRHSWHAAGGRAAVADCAAAAEPVNEIEKSNHPGMEMATERSTNTIAKSPFPQSRSRWLSVLRRSAIRSAIRIRAGGPGAIPGDVRTYDLCGKGGSYL